jgi:hypothetical protein
MLVDRCNLSRVIAIALSEYFLRFPSTIVLVRIHIFVMLPTLCDFRYHTLQSQMTVEMQQA